MIRNSFFIVCLSFIATFWYYSNVSDKSSLPTPSEYVQKKNDKKKHKIERKNWILNMHKSHPDDDWQEMDRCCFAP